jgi:hypothetical protein
VESIRDPSKELGELHCKTNPFPRSYFTAAFFQERVFLFGGKQLPDQVVQDSWYR